MLLRIREKKCGKVAGEGVEQCFALDRLGGHVHEVRRSFGSQARAMVLRSSSQGGGSAFLATVGDDWRAWVGGDKR